jgi:hypothetical protein
MQSVIVCLVANSDYPSDKMPARLLTVANWEFQQASQLNQFQPVPDFSMYIFIPQSEAAHGAACIR